jgi:hypothetical protein
MRVGFSYRPREFEWYPELHEEFTEELHEFSPAIKHQMSGESALYEVAGELSGAALASAVQANRNLARRLGWGCVTGGHVQPIPEVRALLGLGPIPTENDLALAIERWQNAEFGRGGDGKLGPRTWGQMLRRRVIPTSTFRPASWQVFFRGRRLGVLEKTSPYLSLNDGARGGAEIELGFRVTDIEAVKNAGFVDGSGEDRFRWIQVVEFITVPSAASPVGFIRRASQVIDPTALVGAIPDPHPYYWDEVTPAGGTPTVHISRHLNRQARNRLCYDLIFYDRPSAPLAVALPGRRAYFKFEVALVGVQPGPPIRNTILNTVLWGYDIVLKGGTPAVHLSILRPGPRGGSAVLRRLVGQATNAGDFPGHCFVGSGFTGTARCP